MIATVILSAGRGERIGGMAKPLLRYPGEPPFAVLAVQAALQADTHPVLVLGHAADDVHSALLEEHPELAKTADVVVVPGADNRADPPLLSDSLRTGITRATALGAETIVVTLVDQPGIGGRALRHVLAVHRPGQLTRGAVDGRPGHPVVFGAADALAAAAAAQGDQGARSYLTQHADRVVTVNIAELADDTDIDTKEQYRATSQDAATRPTRGRSGPW